MTPRLSARLAQTRIQHLKYTSIRATLEMDLAVEEKLEARTMRVGLRAAALQSDRMRMAQSMYVVRSREDERRDEEGCGGGLGVDETGAEQSQTSQPSQHVKTTRKTRSAVSLSHTALAHAANLPATADLSVSNSAATSISDAEDKEENTADASHTSPPSHSRSRCQSEAEEYKPDYGHISLIKVPDAVRKHARNWSQGGRTSKEIVSPTHPISLND